MDKMSDAEGTVLFLVAIGLVTLVAYAISNAVSSGPHMRKEGAPETLPPAQPTVDLLATSAASAPAASGASARPWQNHVIAALIAGAIAGAIAGRKTAPSVDQLRDEVDQLRGVVRILEHKIDELD